MNSPHQVFISYASPDKDRILPYCNWLKERGINIWVDFDQLLTGQNWDFEIKRALDKSELVLIFLSKSSVNKRGYVQREIKFALDKLSEKLIDDIYILPILLDDIQIPEELKHIQFIKATESGFLERIFEAINYQFERLGLSRKKGQQMAGVTWDIQTVVESYNGIPGNEVEIQILELKSDRFSDVSMVTDVIKGKLIKELLRHRTDKINSMPELFSFDQPEIQRRSTYSAICSEPNIVGKILSIQYSINSYGVGAAHGNSDFETYSFLIDPLLMIGSLWTVFKSSDKALGLFQKEARAQLLKKIHQGKEKSDNCIDSGTENWGHFKSFVFSKNGIKIHFPPYQVACYAAGSHVVEIPYSLIKNYFKPEIKIALELN